MGERRKQPLKMAGFSPSILIDRIWPTSWFIFFDVFWEFTNAGIGLYSSTDAPGRSSTWQLGISWKSIWKNKGDLATLLQLDSIGMLLSIQMRSASEDTDSTATSQASMRTWVPFDFMAYEVWENLLRLQSLWHLLLLTSHICRKKH